ARRQLQRRLKVRAAVRAERAPDPDEHVAEPARASLQRVERHAALAEHVHELAFRPSVASAVREPECRMPRVDDIVEHAARLPDIRKLDSDGPTLSDEASEP